MKHMIPASALILIGVLGGASLEEEDEPILQGVVEASRIVRLSSASEGLLEEVLVDRGDAVQAGQVLARLESSVERARVALARARFERVSVVRAAEIELDFHTRLLERETALYETGDITADRVDRASADKRVAEMALLEARELRELDELELERVSAELELRTIRSPVTGVVLERHLTGGELLSHTRDSMVLKLAQLDPLYVEVVCPTGLRGTIARGMEAEIALESPLEETLEARVTAVDAVIDPVSETFGVRLEIPNPNSTIPPGSRCRVRFRTR